VRTYGIAPILSCLIRMGITAYRLVLSPLFPRSCRFAPTCSRYAEEAVSIHGPVRGSCLALRRIMRCHPWNPGGYDPVPGTNDLR